MTALLDDYEEGTLGMEVPVRQKWWQFWLPKTVYTTYAIYMCIGDKTHYVLKNYGTIIGERNEIHQS